MQPDGEGWIEATEAMRLLDISRTQLNYLARQGELTRWQARAQKGFPGWFRLDEVKALAASRGRRLRAKTRQQRTEKRERLQQMELWPENEPMLTLKEAATLIGVSEPTVKGMIARGRLLSCQEQPGRNGSPHRIPLRSAEAVRDSPRRQKRRAAWEKGTTYFGKGGGKIAEAEDWPTLTWLTTKMVAAWLGISEARVHYLRRTGRIYAYKRPQVNRWAHNRRDVEALLADPQFQKKRAGWHKAQATMEGRQVALAMEANGWNSPDHLPAYAQPGIW